MTIDKGQSKTKDLRTVDEAMEWVRKATAARVKARSLVERAEKTADDAHAAYRAASRDQARARHALNEALSK